jgi:hypothetical protein
MSSFPYRINAGADVEINANGRIKHNASVQYLHGDDSLLADIQGLTLASGDVLSFNGSNIVPKASSDFANASDLANYLATSDVSSTLDAQNVVRTSDLSPYALASDMSSTYQTKSDMSNFVANADLSGSLDGLNVVRTTDLAGYALSSDVSTNYQSKSDMAGYLQTSDLKSSIQGFTDLTITGLGISGDVLQNSVKRSGVVVMASHANSLVTAYDLDIAGSSNVFKISAKSTLKGSNGSVCTVKKEVVMHLSAGACLPVAGTDDGSYLGASDAGNELQITFSTTHAYIKVQSTAANDASGAKSVVEYEIVEC